MTNVLKDLIGQRFERLVVVGRAATNSASGSARWICQCDCGVTTIVHGDALRRGNSRSCGCLARELAASAARRHGLYGTPEYQSVQQARERCTNPRNEKFASYGARGIEYRLPWNPGDAARLIIATLGQRPPGMTLDRIDNDGHYEIGNLRWATASEQMINRRPLQRGARGRVAPKVVDG